MDSWEGPPEEPEDWAEKKEPAKNLRYEHLRAFLEAYSKRKPGKMK